MIASLAPVECELTWSAPTPARVQPNRKLAFCQLRVLIAATTIDLEWRIPQLELIVRDLLAGRIESKFPLKGSQYGQATLPRPDKAVPALIGIRKFVGTTAGDFRVAMSKVQSAFQLAG